MSAGAHTVGARRRPWDPPRLRDAAAATHEERPWIRLATFTALAAYGTQRWASLLRPAPAWRLVGLLIVAAVMAATRKRWTAWLAAVYSVIALVADRPHQVPEILHPVSVTHTVGAVILLVVGVVAIAVALRAALGRDI